MKIPWLSEVTWARESMTDQGRFRWGRLGNDYIGHWADLLVLRVDASGQVSARVPLCDVTRPEFEKLAHGEAAAFVRALSGRFSIHAAAVALGPYAVVLTGASGAGKSTIAHALCDAPEAMLLADDVAGLEVGGGRLRVEPSERFVWLDDGRGVKSAVPRRSAAESAEIAALVTLRFDMDAHSLNVRRLKGASAVESLLDTVLRFDPAPALWLREFDMVTTLASLVPVWELTRSKSLSAREVSECVARIGQPLQQD